ncbi:MAG: nucleoside phosphorylase [Candidatus Bathyarchaeia archaeon]
MVLFVEKMRGILDEDEPVFTPHDVVRYDAQCRGVDIEHFQIPTRLILLYQRNAFEYAKKVLEGKNLEWLYGASRPFCTGLVGGKEIGAFRAWVGAPAAAAMLEELIACGAKSIFEVGMAGSLQDSLKPGDIVVVTEAIRDEGTSNHYFQPEVRLESSPGLKDLLIRHLDLNEIKYCVGSVWTTDGAYRETRSKLLKFRKQGALAVNMETSALFAVAKYRDVEIASVQVISDVLSEEGWQPAFRDEKVSSGLRVLLDVVVEALAEL